MIREFKFTAKIKLSILLLFMAVNVFAQSAKSFYKAARKDEKVKNYTSAIANYTKALELKKNNYKYLMGRAFDYNLINEKANALADYEEAFKVKNSDKNLYMSIVNLSIALKQYQKGKEYAEKLYVKDSKNTEAFRKAAYCCIMLKQFQRAVELCNAALEKEQYNHVTHYYKALALDSMKNYTDANLDYVIAIKLIYNHGLDDNKKVRAEFKSYFYDQAFCLHHLGDFKNAIKYYTTAIEVDNTDAFEPKSYMVYYRRSQSYLSLQDYLNPLGDLNKALVLNKEFVEGFMQRAEVYVKTSQYQSAINDYTNVLILNQKNARAYKSRAFCYQQLASYAEAIVDYTKAVSLDPYDKESKTQLDVVTKKLYEANRENDAPEFKVTYPFIDGAGFINVYTGQMQTVLEGSVKDKSLISSIKVNGFNARFKSAEKNPDFVCDVPLTDASKLEIEVKDVYGNVAVKTIKLGRINDESRVKVDFAGMIISDDGNKTPVSGKKINLVNEKGEVFFTTFTDNSGAFKFENLPYDKAYLLAFDVDDNTLLSGIKSFVVVNNKGETILRSSSDKKGSFKFEVLPNDPVVMSLMSVDDSPLMIDMRGKLLGADGSKVPISNVTLVLVNEKGEVIAKMKTDENGEFNFRNLSPTQTFIIQIDEADGKNITFNKIIITDINNKVIKEIIKDQNGKFAYKLLPTECALLSVISEEIADPWIGAIKLNSTKKEISIIENIYYTSGAFAITKDAEAVLQKAFRAMTENPKIILEVQSHTDAIAGDDFNMELSQKRAGAVVDYLIKLGINKKRLTAKGLGETSLANKCANGVECSDAEHKQNRRTVFVLSYEGSK